MTIFQTVKKTVLDVWQHIKSFFGGDDEHEDDGSQAPPEDWSGAQTQSRPVTDRPEIKDVEYVMVSSSRN